MADRIEHLSVTVPAGTLSTAPLETALTLTPADVERVDIYIPAGHAGLTGFRLAVAHSPILPYNVGAFIVGENERLTYPLEDFPDSGQWACVAYNTDVFDHTFYFTFLLVIVRQRFTVVGGPSPYVAPVDTTSLGNAPVVVPVSEPTPTPTPEPGPTPEPEPEPEPLPIPESEPEPAPAPPPPPPPPASKYAEYYGWQADGDVHRWHWYVEGPRAPQLVLVEKVGNYGKAPTHLSATLTAQGWYAAASAFPLGGKALWQKFLGFGYSN